MKKDYKKIPSYWWDFNGDDNEIIVESDHWKFPIVGRFKFIENDYGDRFADKAIEQVEKLIQDLQAGRVTPKNA